MAGEGLGKDPATCEKYLKSESFDVVSVGDFVVDKIIPLDGVPRNVLENWGGQDWFPREGESIAATPPTEELENYVEQSFPGGKAANQALAATHAGATTAFLGETAWEERELKYMSEAGVDISNLSYKDGKGNEAYVFLDEGGENRITANIKQGTGIEYVEAQKDLIFGSEVLLLSNGMPTPTFEAVIDILENNEGSPNVVLDPSPTNGIEPILSSKELDYSTPNQVEYQQLYQEMDLDHTVLETSAEGVRTPNDFVESPCVEDVVDTTAAGDTFNGYLAAELAKKNELVPALEIACRAASRTVQKNGAQPSIPKL